MNIGVVIADAGRARIFSTKRLGSALENIKDLSNPYSKQREQQLTSDRSGHTVSPTGSGHTMSNRALFKEREAEHFAECVAEELMQSHQHGKFERLYLFASPKFLGKLRQELNPEMAQLVYREFAKDFSLMSEQEIQKHLAQLQ